MRIVTVLGLVALLAAGCSAERRERRAREKLEHQRQHEAERERRFLADHPIPEADERMVAGCQFLGTVEGSSGWGGKYGAAKGMEAARIDAVKSAAEMGATYYVRGDATSGGWGSRATVRAYFCPPQPAPGAPLGPTNLPPIYLPTPAPTAPAPQPAPAPR